MLKIPQVPCLRQGKQGFDWRFDMMRALILGCIACFISSGSGRACEHENPCDGETVVTHRRVIVGHVDRWVHVRRPIYADRPERVSAPRECEQCGQSAGPVKPLVANAIIDVPCPTGGWYLAVPIYGVRVVREDGCGGRLYTGRRIHVNRRGDWNSIEGGGHC